MGRMIQSRLKEIDFIEVDFIDYELKWYTKEEFLIKSKIIKSIYKEMTRRQRQFYKWYCYANIHTSLYQKNAIWDFLNSSIGLSKCKEALTNEKNNYGVKI